MTGKPIYPMAYKIKPGQVETIYYLGFPSSWKQELISIARANNPNFKIEYGLPTHVLQKLIDAWVEGIVAMSALKENSDDSRWLASTIPFDKKRMHILFEILKVWINGTYVSMPKASFSVKSKARDFCSIMQEEDFYNLRTEQEVCLSKENGQVSDDAYRAVPLIVVGKLVGQNIEIGGHTIHLLYASKDELISNVIIDEKSGQKYSFVFQFSVQTTPPERQALLLCNISIRRWISSRKNTERDPYLKNAILAHIKVSNDKICQIPIQYCFQAKGLDWATQDKECYNLYGYTPLPNISDLWAMVENNDKKYLLPYANGMDGFKQSKIGTGVPVRDKAEAYKEFLCLLSNYVDEPTPPSRITKKQGKITCHKSPQDYESTEKFRKWVSSCIETNHICFELYGILDNPKHAALLEQVSEKIMKDFGSNEIESCMIIEVAKKEIGDIAKPVNKEQKCARCDEIRDELGDTNDVVACICIIPGSDSYEANTDPKIIIRNAFACSGRVVQFMVADNEDENYEQKVKHAVYDLYRQLGIVTLLNIDKLESHRFKDVACVGMYVFTQVHGINSKARFMPVWLTVDLHHGKTRVQCDAFENKIVNYRQACLEMAKLYWEEDLENKCKNSQFSPAKQKLIELKNRNRELTPETLVLVHSDGNTRPLWNGISDKSISSYHMCAEYMPTEIDAGSNKSPYMMDLNNTGIRIMRVRDNNEVPDYYTSQRGEDDKYSSATGVFRYGKVFWTISPKPYDPKYNQSLEESRFEHPYANYAEKDMIELYPIQLQPNDTPDEWIKYVSDLCSISIQYEKSTVLPLPLHLAKNLTEYLLE